MFPTLQTILILAFFFQATVTAPTNLSDDDVSDYEDLEIIDQRQNGTENYRLHINGVVMVVSPPMGLFSSAEILDSDLIPVNQNRPNKPQKPNGQTDDVQINLVDSKPKPDGNSPTKHAEKFKMTKLRLPIFLTKFVSRRAHAEKN